jgi:predicted pyridoxine 5'-phosphate oxidase superfamily flavin-nucleotide-binding protein
MNRLYGPVHRSLQDRFDTRRLAENVEAPVVLTEIPREHKAFIESRNMFFLSTIDHHGRPTVSYKGGDPGFVRVLDGKTVAPTATACSIQWVTCSGTPKSACCS